MNQISLNGEHLTLEEVVAVATAPKIEVVLSDDGWEKVGRAERAVKDFVAVATATTSSRVRCSPSNEIWFM